MVQSVRALRAARTVILFVVSVGVSQASPGQADDARPTPDSDLRLADFCQLVRHFDFNERPLGNYEETPMYWHRLAGPGLPRYARGLFDDEIGHAAPPSFQLRLVGGNVCYEYRETDLAVMPGSDYRVVAYVRTEGLRHARAFIEIYLADRYGEAIPHSNRISDLIESGTAEPSQWHRLQVDLPGDYPTAFALRLRLWVLQSYVWHRPSAMEVDPIVRRDIRARAWFDDVSIFRLPRARLRLSNRVGLVAPGRDESFLLEFARATSHGLEAEFVITDNADRVCYTRRADVPVEDRLSGALWADDDSQGVSSSPQTRPVVSERASIVRLPVPPLEPGVYRAALRVLADEHVLMRREIRFAVLAELPFAGYPHPDLGVDLGAWPGGDPTSVCDLLAALGCGAVKLGLPMMGVASSHQEIEYFHQVNELILQLPRRRIEAAGVILSRAAALDPETGLSTQELVESNSNWRRLFSPALARFSGLLPAWQLGSEPIELRYGHGWDPALVDRVRAHLARFVAVPELVVPFDTLSPPPPEGDAQTIWVPASIPARTLPRQLEFLAQPGTARRWLTLECERRPELEHRWHLIDVARRIVLAKALRPERIFVRAPIELASAGGAPGWQPTEGYVVLRTLFHALCGKQAIGAIALENDGVAVIFSDADSSCLVLWTWRDEPLSTPLELYLGQAVHAVDLWGRPQPAELAEGRTRLRLTPLPTIVHGVEAPLAMLHASLQLDPTCVQLYEPQAQPTLSFRNYYDQPMAGRIVLELPRGWALPQQSLRFSLGPGETFEHVLDLTVPPRQVAAQHELGVHLSIDNPVSRALECALPITIGLADITLEAEARWVGDDLVVKQLLRNLSQETVSFTGFCQAPARPRAHQEFLNVCPGEQAVRVYQFMDARELVGLTLHLGIQQIRGRRALDQLVEVPQ